MSASGFQIPLRDASVDGTVCVRLTHHLPTETERVRLVRELLRVSRRFVIMSFFDYYSPKNTLRRLSRPFNRKPPKSTMKVRELRRLAQDCGATLVESPPFPDRLRSPLCPDGQRQGMKHDSSNPSYSLQVYPRGGRLPEGIQVDLNPLRGICCDKNLLP